MSSGWKRVWSKAEIWSRDSWQLASAMIRSVPRSSASVRDVLVQYARRSNLAAVSLLQVDREVGLLRYWGLTGYMRHKQVGWNWHVTRRWFYQTPHTDQTIAAGGDDNLTSKLTTSIKPKVPTARVAFMVTAAMRQELTERLSYSEEQIRKMTPLQASLILQHDVPSHELESKLPDLEYEHFETLEAANQAAAVAAMSNTTPPTEEAIVKDVDGSSEVEVKQQDGENGDGDNDDNDDDDDDDGETNKNEVTVNPEESEEPRLTIPMTSTSTSGMAIEQLLPMGIPAERSGIAFIDSINDVDAANALPDKIWFELIEHDTADRESAVVGLYRDVVEAQLALETRQLFERRRAKDKERPVTTSFVISRVLR